MKKLLLLLLIFVSVILAYLLIRYFITSDINAMINELFAAIIGVLLTVVATSFLLSKQTQSDVQKEHKTLLFSYKFNLYDNLIDRIEEIIASREVDEKDLIGLMMLNQKVSIVGSESVILNLSLFIQSLMELKQTENLHQENISMILECFHKISLAIREDLQLDSDKNFSRNTIEGIIRSNKLLNKKYS